MKKHRIKTVSAIAAVALMLLPCPSSADNSFFEVFPESESARIKIYPDKEKTPVSKYIYGAADKGGLYKDSPAVIKQTGLALSTYNWETNFSNSGAAGRNLNDMSLVNRYPASKWSIPALYVNGIFSRSNQENIPVRLVTLPMMGYVAKDNLGIVSPDEPRSSRWTEIKYTKNDTYLNHPDTEDEYVYIDEYVSYLVNRYGSSFEGGIQGYFLDSEPDRWTENFAVEGMQPVTPEELVERSAELSLSVKTLDSKAYVLGPSVSGLSACIDLNNPEAWSSYEKSDYSWFADFYLSEMRKKSEECGIRLLDVFDIHYFTEATTPVGNSVIDADDNYSNAYRMQSVRTLWDPDYTENSVSVLMNKQFTPLIPTIRASAGINYPGTKISISEYDFGGGNNMSGAIAQIDALGTFAREGVFLACLCPRSDSYVFQEAGLKFFTNYDGKGSSFGKNLIAAGNDDSDMTSAYAACDDDTDCIRIIVTNKNQVKNKRLSIDIVSAENKYELSDAYTISHSSGRIIPARDIEFTRKGSKIYFTAETESAYLLVLNVKAPEETEETGEPEMTSVPEESGTEAVSSDTEVSSFPEDESFSGTGEETEVITPEESGFPPEETEDNENSAYDTVPYSEETSVTVSVTSVTESVPEITSEAQTTAAALPEDIPNVALPVKILVSILAFSVVGGVVYILFFDY